MGKRAVGGLSTRTRQLVRKTASEQAANKGLALSEHYSAVGLAICCRAEGENDAAISMVFFVQRFQRGAGALTSRT